MNSTCLSLTRSRDLINTAGYCELHTPQSPGHVSELKTAINHSLSYHRLAHLPAIVDEGDEYTGWLAVLQDGKKE